MDLVRPPIINRTAIYNDQGQKTPEIYVKYTLFLNLFQIDNDQITITI